ncbi:protein mono-ADP-ribosyltransferase PARP12-like isoform X2 [Sardina pilchardus]|uniref:protein mono-ADP-ribosyltransferase PARP12-like isoform X2 n=1 Tax=Sardina pilchardus TaxID=27697 RepID=UPI002E136891
MAAGDEICCLHLIDRCNEREEVCGKVHCRTPYLWQICNNDLWSSLPHNEEIEQDYCNPVKTKHDFSVGNPPLYFNTMTYGSAAVRRLSMTASALSSLITKWVWYWEKSEDIWKEFEPLAGDELERHYLNSATTVPFSAGRHQYELSFLDMFQTNTITRTQRLVRRRPVFISNAEIQKVCDIHCNSAPPVIPDYWDPNLLPPVGYELHASEGCIEGRAPLYKRINLDTSSPEYYNVLNPFDKTMAGCNILSVERIQNLVLWKSFNLQKDDMENKVGRVVPEKFLFHGTKSEYVDAICRENIDWRVCGENGTFYGRGSYFARDAKYSHQFTNLPGPRSMFVCRILVGDFTLGCLYYNKPPFKNKEKAFDSCVNDIRNPSIFVIFEKSQIYPEYLIQYEQPPVQFAPPAQVPQPVQVVMPPVQVASPAQVPPQPVQVVVPPVQFGSPAQVPPQPFQVVMPPVQVASPAQVPPQPFQVMVPPVQVASPAQVPQPVQVVMPPVQFGSSAQVPQPVQVVMPPVQVASPAQVPPQPFQVVMPPVQVASPAQVPQPVHSPFWQSSLPPFHNHNPF